MKAELERVMSDQFSTSHERMKLLPYLQQDIDELAQHVFMIDGIEYEYTRGQYYKNNHQMPERSVFGQIARYERCVRTATIKTMNESIELAWLSKEHFNDELRVIKELEMDKNVKFLRSIHSWRNLKRKNVVRFVNLSTDMSYQRGHTVYTEK